MDEHVTKTFDEFLADIASAKQTKGEKMTNDNPTPSPERLAKQAELGLIIQMTNDETMERLGQTGVSMSTNDHGSLDLWVTDWERVGDHFDESTLLRLARVDARALGKALIEMSYETMEPVEA